MLNPEPNTTINNETQFNQPEWLKSLILKLMIAMELLRAEYTRQVIDGKKLGAAITRVFDGTGFSMGEDGVAKRDFTTQSLTPEEELRTKMIQEYLLNNPTFFDQHYHPRHEMILEYPYYDRPMSRLPLVSNE